MNEKINYDLFDALANIVWYDKHSDWLREVCVELEKAKKEGTNYCIYDMEWHTEIHTIWMLLIGMFGDWGSSIRSGWIEDIDGCIDFIRKLIRVANDEDLDEIEDEVSPSYEESMKNAKTDVERFYYKELLEHAQTSFVAVKSERDHGRMVAWAKYTELKKGDGK